MQPYFPVCDYFQLMAAVDAFVVYDNIKYTKKGGLTVIVFRFAVRVVNLAAAKKNSDFLDIKGAAALSHI